LEFEPFGHSNVTPEVVELAIKRMLGFVQVNWPEFGVIEPGGGLLFKEITEFAVAVQPLLGSVTVTTKFPAVETILMEELFPPPQLNVAPEVVLEAVKVTVGSEHVICPVGGTTTASGAAKSAVTEAETKFVHPFGAVAVTLKFPAAVTVI
jgi:hypothetical protein